MWTSAFSNRSYLFSLVCGALLVGCGTPKGKFQSRKDPAYKGKLDRVLIIYHNEEESVPQLGRKFADAMLTRLSELLAQKHVEVEIVRPKKEELDENASVRTAAARFQPRQELHWGLTRVFTRTRSSAVGDPPRHETFMTFAFSLVDVPHDQIVWRGELSYYVLPGAEAVADQFVEQLVTEGFSSGPQ